MQALSRVLCYEILLIALTNGNYTGYWQQGFGMPLESIIYWSYDLNIISYLFM